MTIFVSIASYKDPILWNTVSDCINNAEFPDKIKFGIVDQSDIEFDIDSHPNKKQITYFHFNPKYSRGPCWARSIANSFYTNEDFVLQIDAHTIFDKNWDTILIQTLNKCRTKSPKSLISSYPPAFKIVDGEFIKNIKENVVVVFKPNNNAVINEKDPGFGFIGYEINSNEPILGYHVAGGLIFAPGDFLLEVPYDPNVYFLGEEQNIAIRAWTSGWDLYQIPNIPIYHLYYSSSLRPLHWDKEDDKDRQLRWFELRDISSKRLCDLLFNQKNLGKYGLGSVRSLNDFAEFSGINYLDKTINRVNNSN
jgi:hypothetical protein